MDVLQKAKRIKALSTYIEYSSIEVHLNYHLNGMISTEGKTFKVNLADIYDNIYKVIGEDGLVDITPEQFEKIVSDVSNQFYHIAYQKAYKKALLPGQCYPLPKP